MNSTFYLICIITITALFSCNKKPNEKNVASINFQANTGSQELGCCNRYAMVSIDEGDDAQSFYPISLPVGFVINYNKTYTGTIRVYKDEIACYDCFAEYQTGFAQQAIKMKQIDIIEIYPK